MPKGFVLVLFYRERINLEANIAIRLIRPSERIMTSLFISVNRPEDIYHSDLPLALVPDEYKRLVNKVYDG